MKILFFGDVFGKPGREALKFIIHQWKKEYEPDIIIANGENMSHGAGISESSINELLEAGVQIITGGNHTFEGKDASKLLNDPKLPLLRPANMPAEMPGRGYAFFKIKNNFLSHSEPGEEPPFSNIDQKPKILPLRTAHSQDDKNLFELGSGLLVINLIGQVHMRYHYDSPFNTIDKILKNLPPPTSHPPLPIMVDWHAEASSEKVAMGWYLDGRVSAVLGTHSHTPTADERILPQGTGFVSDIGMVGPHNSIIGQEITANLERFIKQIPKKVEVAGAPPYEMNAVLLEIDEKTGKTVKIQRLRKILLEERL